MRPGQVQRLVRPRVPRASLLCRVRGLARLLRNGAKEIAEEFDMTAEELLSLAVRHNDKSATFERRKVARLEIELADLEAPTAEAERVARGRALLPSTEVLDKLTRYESHLARQVAQTLLLLERLQDTRIGNPTPPTVLNVTTNGGPAERPPLALAGESNE